MILIVALFNLSFDLQPLSCLSLEIIIVYNATTKRAIISYPESILVFQKFAFGYLIGLAALHIVTAAAFRFYLNYIVSVISNHPKSEISQMVTKCKEEHMHSVTLMREAITIMHSCIHMLQKLFELHFFLATVHAIIKLLCIATCLH